jgi:hypothetical protein
MNAPEPRLDWIDANQRLLVAEFARLKARLAGNSEEAAHAAVDSARSAMPRPAAVDVLAECFGLSAFERDLLLLAAGVEMDGALATACARTNGDGARMAVSFGLALAMLDHAHWSALAPTGALRRWMLVVPDEGDALCAARLRIDERILHFMAGIDVPAPRLGALVRAARTTRLMAPSHHALCDELHLLLGAAPDDTPVVVLYGSNPRDAEDIAATCAMRLGWRLQVADAAGFEQAHDELAALATLFEREARMAATALLVDCGDAEPSPNVLAFIERAGGPIFVRSPQALDLRRTSVQRRIALPTRTEQRALWCEALGESAPAWLDEIARIGSHFRLATRAIEEVANRFNAGIAASPAHAPAGTLWNACRNAAPDRLSQVAEQVDAQQDGSDLILSAGPMRMLAQIAMHMRLRGTVQDEWGFAAKDARGLGVTVLFSGESGTGKTFAAEVLARQLALDLFRIDLSGIVSKYIGETEKNLRRVFDAAEGSGAILLFDEADALFGKRSEVKDSHDRYANIEVSYLLQRMENYHGMAILTSNHKAALDNAFVRRLRFIVPFPFPEPAEREAIWRSVLPAAAPVQSLNFSTLARLAVPGGTIRNIALKAAFLAADAGTPITMTHLLDAARTEAANREKTLTDAETRGWASCGAS